jgi:hypothetical protein
MTSVASEQTEELLKLLNEHAALFLSEEDDADTKRSAQIRKMSKSLQQRDKVLLPDELLASLQESWPFIVQASSSAPPAQVELYHAALTVQALGSVLSSLMHEANRYLKGVEYWKRVELRQSDRLAYLVQSQSRS